MRTDVFLPMEMSHTAIPQHELDVFDSLGDIKVVFDVGARADVDYIQLKPDIELHAFEPNPIFFQQLQDKIGDRPHTFLNNFGLGDIEGEEIYNEQRQAFKGGEETGIEGGEWKLPIKTLDWYVGQKGIERIDFLKIDTEGYDFKVLMGGLKTIQMCQTIQYEHWHNLIQFHELLLSDFNMEYIGERNVVCRRRKI